MPNIYELYDNAANRIEVGAETRNSVKIGNDQVFETICALIRKHHETTGKACRIGFDGNYAVEWDAILSSLKQKVDTKGIIVSAVTINSVFLPYSRIQGIFGSPPPVGSRCGSR